MICAISCLFSIQETENFLYIFSVTYAWNLNI